MKIILDIRENALFDKMILQNPSIEKQQLSLGDALLQTDDGNTIIMVERKSISDLLASIKYGRY
jgi:ERCC4-type nuclease